MNTLSLATASLRVTVLSLAFMPAIASAQHAPHEWTYKGAEGPKEWGKLDPAFTACTSGRSQSPINIQDTKKGDLPALKFDYKAVPLNITDNGHSIQVTYTPGSTLTIGDKTYNLRQFHFHHPSEEHVRGHGYDMVAHLVHTDEAGHYAVVAILLERGKPNALIDSLWKNIPTEKEKPVDVPDVTINIQDLLPADHGYYTYDGSLTIPPCSEGVTWYVLKTPVTISEAQFERFAKLYPSDARPIQPANHRAVLETK
jgi:carbonic anhydrase